MTSTAKIHYVQIVPNFIVARGVRYLTVEIVNGLSTWVWTRNIDKASQFATLTNAAGAADAARRAAGDLQ